VRCHIVRQYAPLRLPAQHDRQRVRHASPSNACLPVRPLCRREPERCTSRLTRMRI
jgi:hypothetical protein